MPLARLARQHHLVHRIKDVSRRGGRRDASLSPGRKVKERLVRLRVLCEGLPPDLSSLGTLLSHERDRNQARVVLLDPDPVALAELRTTPGVREMQETPLTLEEA